MPINQERLLWYRNKAQVAFYQSLSFSVVQWMARTKALGSEGHLASLVLCLITLLKAPWKSSRASGLPAPFLLPAHFHYTTALFMLQLWTHTHQEAWSKISQTSWDTQIYHCIKNRPQTSNGGVGRLTNTGLTSSGTFRISCFTAVNKYFTMHVHGMSVYILKCKLQCPIDQTHAVFAEISAVMATLQSLRY